jgi:trans-2-enoyl-CoA reductase
MEERHLNRSISVNKDGRLCIDNQEVDSDMILFEEEAKNLLEQELMEGPHYNPMEEDVDNFDGFDNDRDYDRELDSDGDDIFFRDGYFDISNDDFDAIN